MFYQYEEPLMSPTLFPTYKKVRGCAKSVYPPLVATYACMMYFSCMSVCVSWCPLTPDPVPRTRADDGP